MMVYKEYKGYTQSDRIQLEILIALDKINDNLERLSIPSEQKVVKNESESTIVPITKIRSKRGEK